MVDRSNMDNRREYIRNTMQKVVIVIDDKPYLAIDWSPDGFSIHYTIKKLNPGDEIDGHIDVFELENMGEFKGLTIRHEDNDILAVQFTNLSSHVFMNLCMSLHQPVNETIN